MSRADCVSALALTPAQAGMLFHSQLAPRAGFYIQQIVVGLREPLNGVLHSAWYEILSRYSVLRTSFHLEADHAEQVVHDRVTMPVVELDWTNLCAAEQELELRRFLAEDRARGFDPAIAPLSRLALIRRGERDSLMVWTFHHALLDGRSHRLVLEDLFHTYDQLRRTLPPSNDRYSRPFEEHLDWLVRRDLTEAERHWRSLLAGFTTPVPFPAVIGPRPDESPDWSTRSCSMPIDELRGFARRQDVTLATIIHAAVRQ